ncbi:MAG: tRNA lysidine(34) synthetase TilS, partial [Planctomycetes bacterium]|nr:tRNA lysidine(34) synthetase TilS [Planctomycetota bacterium]
NELGDKMLASAIREQAPGRLCLAAAELLAQGPMVASQAIRSALVRMAAPMGPIGMEHIRQVVDLLDADAGAAVDLPGGVRVFRQFDLLVLELGQSSGHADDAEPVPLPLGGTTQLPDSAVLSVTIRPGNQADLARFLIGKPADAEMLDADSLIEPLTARRWRDGDRFVPLGAGGSQKLSDFFCSAKVPPAGRRAAWIVCDRLGPIWVAPYRIAHRARITPATGRLALLRLQRRQGRA